MKYIILSKNINKGIVGDDSSNLNSYFELGWEVVGSRVEFVADNKCNFHDYEKSLRL
jgi:hypothetical protein